MLPLKLVRSLVLGEAIINPFLHSGSIIEEENVISKKPKSKKKKKKRRRRRTPLMLFTPTQEIVTDTHRLAALARDIGMDLYPNPSLSHIIFSYPSSSSSDVSSSSWSSTTSLLWSLPDDAVPLPFPSFANASLTHLRLFVTLTKGFFKLVFLNSDEGPATNVDPAQSACSSSGWDCSSLSLVSRITGERIESMDGFSKALLGVGWTLFKTNSSKNSDNYDNDFCNYSQDGSTTNNRQVVFLFRKRIDLSGSIIRKKSHHSGDDGGGGESCYRLRELKLPPLDFRNTPLRILHYILLMTDDVFHLE